MVTWEQLGRLNLEEKKPDGFERMSQVAQIIMAAAAVFALFQDKIVWFVVFGVALVLVYVPILSRMWRRRRLKAKQKEALARYTNDFLTLMKRAQDFVESNNQYDIPQFLMNIVTRQGMEIKRYNQHVESFFTQVLHSNRARVDAGFGKYGDFERAAQDLCNLMDSFVQIFANDIIQELKQPKNFALLQPYEVSGLKQRYAALSQFVNDYNGFASKLATFWGQKNGMQIRIPTETID